MIRGLFAMKVMRHEELRRGGCLGDGDFRPRMLDKAEEALQGLLGIYFCGRLLKQALAGPACR